MKLTVAQRTAAAHISGNALVLSGPGTGKTATLVERCRLLVSKGVPLDSLFITTFTQKAASEIKSRIIKTNLNEGFHSDSEKIISSAYIGTFHSLCARMLKQYPGDAWLPYDFTIIGEEEQKKFINGLGFEWDEEEGNVIELISKWKDSLIAPDLAVQNSKQLGSKFFINAANAYKEYEKEKKSQSMVDFSDLILYATNVLKANNDASSWFHNRFSHFIVDEFQDVNKSQIEFLRAALGQFGSIWAVADEDQSLYEWRGSNPKYCLNFEKIFPNTKIYQLNDNFRSPPLVISLSQAVIRNNRERFNKELKPAKKKNGNDAVYFKGFNNEYQEADWISSLIQNYTNNNVALNDIAILVRTSNILTPIQRALEVKNIPFQLNGTHSFWDMPEVSFFVDAVALINNERSFIDRKHLGSTIIGKKLSVLISEMAGGHIRNYANAIANILYEYIPKNLDTERRQSWLSSVESVMNLALDFDDANKFLEYCRTKRSETRNIKLDSINISTIHASKGLEWPVVIIIGSEEEIIPHFKNNNLEEERRLFYVAMTRAKKNLIATYSHSRNSKPRKPSRFLFEAKRGYKQDLGKFSWKDDLLKEKPEIDKPQINTINEKRAIVKKGDGKKAFRHKGGKSLIPPDERTD